MKENKLDEVSKILRLANSAIGDMTLKNSVGEYNAAILRKNRLEQLVVRTLDHIELQIKTLQQEKLNASPSRKNRLRKKILQLSIQRDSCKNILHQ